MSDIWQELGLDQPTQKIKAIKKAYAKRLKASAADPDRLATLGKAYEDAVTWAEQEIHRQKPLHKRAQSVSTEDFFRRGQRDHANSNKSINEKISETPKLDQVPPKLFSDLTALMAHPKKCRRLKTWVSFMERTKALDKNDFSLLETELSHQLMDAYGYNQLDLSKPLRSADRQRMDEPTIPPNVLSYIFEVMEWNAKTPVDDGIKNQREWMKIRAGMNEYEQQQMSLSLAWSVVIIIFFLFILPVTLLKYLL